ncbi:hypothetical protein SRHO_G00253110 [Serrasalmus rhombeus]
MVQVKDLLPPVDKAARDGTAGAYSLARDSELARVYVWKRPQNARALSRSVALQRSVQSLALSSAAEKIVRKRKTAAELSLSLSLSLSPPSLHFPHLSVSARFASVDSSEQTGVGSSRVSAFLVRDRYFLCVWTKRAELLVAGVRKEDTLLWISRRFDFLALGHRGSPAFCPDLL